MSTAASYYEIDGRPFVTLSGAAAVRLQSVRGVPEDLAQPLRRAADRQQVLDSASRFAGNTMDVSEAASYFNISKRAVTYHCKNGSLDAYKDRGRWVITAFNITDKRKLRWLMSA